MSTKKWLTGCGLGCGVVAILGIVGVVGGSFVIMNDFKDAIADRETLDARHGDQPDFTPSADGTIAPERMEAFLAVRAAAMTLCDEFMTTAGKFEQMDELDEDASRKEAFSGIMNLTGDIFMMVPRLGGYYQARNGTLLDVGMGLGEYTYIYVLVYGDRLRGEGQTEEADFLSSGDPNARVCEALRQMLRNQQGVTDDVAMQSLLEEELSRLEEHTESIPWQGALPPAIAASIAPYREQLDAVFCPATVGLEFSKNRQSGLSIHSN